MRKLNKTQYFIYSIGLMLLSSDPVLGQPDTLNSSQNTNIIFQSIYRKNVDPGFFGNEYGNAIKTTLVADINPNVILVNSSNSRFFILFSPRVKLRLLDAQKAPVRSPSYMPGLKVYSRLNSDAKHPQILSMGYSHHSNGQDGTTLDSLGRFNRGKGKFTTNYYTLDYITGKRNLSSARSASQYSSVGIELHTGLLNTGFSKELKGKYGFVRINGSWIYTLLKGKSETDKYGHHHRLQAKFTYIADRYGKYAYNYLRRRMNANLQYSFQPGFTDNLAISLGAGYRGQDDYNIYFEDRYSYISVGVTYGVALGLQNQRK